MKTMIRVLVCSTVAFCAASAAADVPNEALICPPDDPALAETAYLKALSLDLRGTVPSRDEYQVVLDEGVVPEWLIDQWLASEAFADQLVRRHRDLFWNNVNNVNLMAAKSSLTRTNNIYYLRNRAAGYRGIAQLQCDDTPAKFTQDGQIITEPFVNEDGQSANREGWVMVNPFWAPNTEIKVCAFDAQATMVSPSGAECDTRDNFGDTACGCGPNMRWCRYGGTTMRPVQEAIAKDMDLRIKALVMENRPYTELFTGQRAFVNGPLVHFLKHQAPFYANVRLVPLSVNKDALPDLEFTDADTWIEVPLSEDHAGVLTSWAFLVRFQTNRARASRFYNTFLCQPFQPPSGGIPFASEAEALEPDLQIRAGCKYCHALLEPSASFWGRWSENGAGYLNPDEYPAFDEGCFTCATTGQGCNAKCNSYYISSLLSQEQEPYLGWLKSYEFRAPEHMDNPEIGPRVLALTAVVDHRLPTCVSHETASWLLGRGLFPEEGDWLDELAINFVKGEFDYKALIKTVVTSDVYRRVR